jgi:hypothetical protein
MDVVACSVSKKQSSNPKTGQLFQTQDATQRQPTLVDKKSAKAMSKDTDISPYSRKSNGIMSNDLMNSTWDAFGDPRHGNTSIIRTPSPFTQVPMDGDHNKKTEECRLEKHERKRFREGSLAMGSKRFRSSSRSRTDHDTIRVDIETVGDDNQYEEYRASPSPVGREATADELNHAVIILDHDDKLEELIETSSSNWSHVSQKKGPRPLNADYILIDLDEHEDRLYEEVELEAHHQSLLPGRSVTIIASRNLAIAPPWAVEELIKTEMGKFAVGDVVELRSSGFLRISLIIKNLQTDHVKLRGHRLERAREFNGILPKKVNELYLNIEVELDDPRPPMEQGMEEVDLEQVKALRETWLTNKTFPSCSFREKGGYYDLLDAALNAPCVVRWKYSCKYLNGRDRWHNRWNERSVELLKEVDFPKGDPLALFVADAKVRTLYRGNTIPGGAHPGVAKTDSSNPSPKIESCKSSNNPTVVLTDDEPEVEQLRRSVSVVQLSNKSEKAYSSSCERPCIPDRQLQAENVSLSRDIIYLSDSESVALANEGFISPSNTRSLRSVTRKLIVRSPGQKYTYGDCCTLHLLLWI